MSDNSAIERVQRRAELRRLAKVAHDAIDSYVENRLSDNDWFVRDLDGTARKAVRDLVDFDITGNGSS